MSVYDSMSIQINGVGAAIPRRIVSNEAIAAITGTAWILQDSGITKRYRSIPPVDATQLGAIAALQALESARILPQDVTALVVVSTYRPHCAPFVGANAIKHATGPTNAYVVDINSARTGFFDALVLANNVVGSDPRSVAILLGTESFSNARGMQEHPKFHMYSEGAGAFVVSQRPGFAHLASVRLNQLSLQSAQHLSSCTRSGDDALSCLPAAGTQVGKIIEKVIDRNPNKQLQQPIFVLTQDLTSKAVESLPQGLTGYNAFPQCGHFLSASPSLLLFKLLHDHA